MTKGPGVRTGAFFLSAKQNGGARKGPAVSCRPQMRLDQKAQRTPTEAATPEPSALPIMWVVVAAGVPA